jgi:hypothetical protein
MEHRLQTNNYHSWMAVRSNLCARFFDRASDASLSPWPLARQRQWWVLNRIPDQDVRLGQLYVQPGPTGEASSDLELKEQVLAFLILRFNSVDTVSNPTPNLCPGSRHCAGPEQGIGQSARLFHAHEGFGEPRLVLPVPPVSRE